MILKDPVWYEQYHHKEEPMHIVYIALVHWINHVGYPPIWRHTMEDNLWTNALKTFVFFLVETLLNEWQPFLNERTGWKVEQDATGNTAPLRCGASGWIGHFLAAFYIWIQHPSQLFDWHTSVQLEFLRKCVRPNTVFSHRHCKQKWPT